MFLKGLSVFNNLSRNLFSFTLKCLTNNSVGDNFVVINGREDDLDSEIATERDLLPEGTHRDSLLVPISTPTPG